MIGILPGGIQSCGLLVLGPWRRRPRSRSPAGVKAKSNGWDDAFFLVVLWIEDALMDLRTSVHRIRDRQISSFFGGVSLSYPLIGRKFSPIVQS